MKSLFALTLLCAGTLAAQPPLSVDSTFTLAFDCKSVSDIEFLPSGKVLIAGLLHRQGSPQWEVYSTDRLWPDGSFDTSFTTWGGGGAGNITPWNEKFYVQHSQGVSRLDSSGERDFSFYPEGVNNPWFNFGQGGDYYSYADGRVLFSGLMARFDADTNYVGDVGLVRFLPNGLLDSTFHEPVCFNAIYLIHPLADGKFLLDGGLSSYDGHPIDGPFRVFADCSIDTTFHCAMPQGSAYSFLDLPDGKLLMTGSFRLAGDPDIMHIVRLHSDGSLDTTYNNHLEFDGGFPGSALYTPVKKAVPAGPSHYIVVGNFYTVAGLERRSICMIDTAGNLVNDYLNGTGCDSVFSWLGDFVALQGIDQAPDGSYYFYGAYHGFDDGYNYHPDQIMVTRLHGGNVGVQEQVASAHVLHIWPNPASDVVQVEVPTTDKLQWRVCDAMGRTMAVQVEAGATATIGIAQLPAGVYSIVATSNQRSWSCKLLKE